LFHSPTHLFCFTIDVEDSVAGGIAGTEFFLDIFAQYNIKGTFFVTAEAIASYRDLMLRIIDEGHEIASHGFTHYRLSELRPKGFEALLHMSPEELKIEIHRSALAGETMGITLEGFRAPAFGIHKAALEEIAVHFAYDCSFISGSVNHKRSLSLINKLEREKNFRVFAVSRFPVWHIPMGGPYLLGFPKGLQKMFLGNLPYTEPLIYYAHSFEPVDIDREKLNVASLKWFWYYRHCGLEVKEYYSMLIEALLSQGYHFVRMRELLALKHAKKYENIFPVTTGT